jgi:hypothetical protein
MDDVKIVVGGRLWGKEHFHGHCGRECHDHLLVSNSKYQIIICQATNTIPDASQFLDEK